VKVHEAPSPESRVVGEVRWGQHEGNCVAVMQVSEDGDWIKLAPGKFGNSNAFTEGAKVEAKYRGRSRWYHGIIRKHYADGTFDIDYNDVSAISQCNRNSHDQF